MQVGCISLHGRHEIARSLHREPLVVEAHAVEAAQLFAVAGAARPAVIALRHDDAVAGVGRGNRGIDQEQIPSYFVRLETSTSAIAPTSFARSA